MENKIIVFRRIYSEEFSKSKQCYGCSNLYLFVRVWFLNLNIRNFTKSPLSFYQFSDGANLENKYVALPKFM